MSRIAGIDPGTTHSGLVRLNSGEHGHWPPKVTFAAKDMPNADLLASLTETACDLVVCEWLTSYGGAIGATVLDTARMVGRIEERASAPVCLITRPDVGLELCQSRRAKNAQLRAAILEMYPATGGGKDGRLGTSKAPGPLYSVSSHAWSALAAALAWMRREGVTG